jgi:hypothetical protein
MTKDQEDKLNMYQAVDGVLQSHNSVWTANTEFSAAVDELEDNIDSIVNLAEQQDEDITGVTEDKDEARAELETNTLSVASIVVFWASKTGNRKLVKKVNYTKTELHDARDNELPTMGNTVYKEANANSAALLPFGLTAGMITTLQTSISTFQDYISKPREALADTSAATKQLPPVFAATDKLLAEQLDNGMALYQVSHPDFYTQYFNARVIVNSPTLTRALEAHFEDFDTGLPLEHVSVLVDINITRRSSEKGNIRVQSLDEGRHHITAGLPGYVTAGEDFNVILGETTKLVIKLRKV